MRTQELPSPKILVVDDEERIRDACTMVLEEQGYDVATADNGELGLKMIEEKHYDVILLDLMMPNLSGLEVLPQLKERHPDTAVIVITGYATVEHSIEAMKKGAFDFIPKPFTPDQLRTIVAKTIKYIEVLQDIQDSTSRLRVMVNRLQDGVMTTDINRRIVLVNPSFLDMVGYSGENPQDRLVTEVVTQEPIIDAIDKALAIPAETFAEQCREMTISSAESNVRSINLHCSPFRNRAGQILGTTTVLHDITAQKEMDRLKSEFVSMVSHEIRSPMNSLLAQIKIILDGLAGEVTEKQRQILERASGKINNLVEMVSELLDLARIEAGMVGRELQDVRIVELVDEQVSFHRAAAAEKDIAITTLLAEDLPPIAADKQGLDEVLTNLLTNAVKYSPENTEIEVSAGVEGDQLVIRVSDRGYGIPEEDLAEIFTRFHRVKDKNTREIHGTGLGLAIVKSIVDAHGGTISVESKLEEGTTFAVFLPLKPTER